MTKEDYLEQIEVVNHEGIYKPSWESLSKHESPKWFCDAKFGIFIHYGLYSVPAFGNEWYSRSMYNMRSEEYKFHIEHYGTQKDFGYKDFIPMFTAEKFDAKRWIEVFKNAGAKYIVPVMEHHDGFSMYDSELNRWNAAAMGPKKNICGELKVECENQGLVFCGSSHRAEHYYFMNLGREIESDVSDDNYRDFYGPAVLRSEYINVGFDGLTENPECVGPDKDWLDDWLVKTAEIIDKYQPLMIYFDTAIQNKEYKPYLKKLCAYYYNRAVEWDKEVTICYKHYAFPPDVATFDMERGGLHDISPRYWQTDTAIGNKSWGYIKNNTFKSSYKLICDLIDTVSKNGNFLLNIGPKADGSFTKEEENVLKEIGEWLSKNGEGIYGTSCWNQYKEGNSAITGGSFNDSEEVEYNESDYRFTYKNGYVYAFWMKPIDADAKIKAFKHQPMRGMIIDHVSLLSTGENLQFERRDTDMIIKKTKSFVSDSPLCFRISLV